MQVHTKLGQAAQMGENIISAPASAATADHKDKSHAFVEMTDAFVASDPEPRGTVFYAYNTSGGDLTISNSILDHTVGDADMRIFVKSATGANPWFSTADMTTGS